MFLLAATLVLPACLLVGCGGGSKFPTVKVSGKVTLDGQPLAKGSINVSPQGEGQDDAAPIVNGAYTLTKAPKGKVKVYFSAVQETGKMLPGTSGSAEIAEVKNIIPDKYAAGVDQEITQSREDLNFELSSK